MSTATRALRGVSSGETLHDRIRKLNGAVPCRSRNPEVFFDETFAGVESAKTTCRLCPLNQFCLAEALARNESCGVWGGELLRNGEVVRTMPSGRARSSALNPVESLRTSTPRSHTAEVTSAKTRVAGVR
ncbi:WhiB family transcriptional regulator [Embleya sp. NPDC001921]